MPPKQETTKQEERESEREEESMVGDWKFNSFIFP